MHTLTIQTKYTFGDHVWVESPSQHYYGLGVVAVITVDGTGLIDYMIEGDNRVIQPGILEGEMTLSEERDTF